jgi:tyrosinase
MLQAPLQGARLLLALFGLLAVHFGGSADAADILKRKNIDDLTPAELSAYEHAIQIMKDRSAKNPYDKSGYLWQAWVHNCPATWVPKDGKPDNRVPGCDFWLHRPSPDESKYVRAHPGMCEHGKDLFLPWHRAQFYYFEKVLQGTDPDGTIADSRGQAGPSTRMVTVPYWNWTRPPSGKRYPQALENPQSPLHHAKRAEDPIATGMAYPYASRYPISYMIHFQDWPRFGGYEKGTRGGFGSLESVSHNPMHSQYMAGDMGHPGTAALDPGFYSFHSYIDLILEQWIEANGTDDITSKDYFLRADQPPQVPPPPGFAPGLGNPSMGQVKLYLDTRKLGYEYEVKDEDKPVARAELIKIIGLENSPDPPVFGEAARSLLTRLLERGGYRPNATPGVVHTLDIAIPSVAPDSNDQRFFALFNRNPHEPDVSYQMDVYLYPKLAPFDPASEPFRNRYLAATGVYWGTGAEHHHEQTTPLRLDVTRAMLDLIGRGRSGETWLMSTAVTPLPVLTTFGAPTLDAVPPLR